MKLPAGHRLLHFERIDSTNAEAFRLASAGEAGPLWIWADEQSNGRGRLGRNWVSNPGNLYVTHLFQSEIDPSLAPQVSFVGALAVHDMVAGLLPKRQLQLKWPNDVLMEGAKFCGLLAEVVASNPTRIAVGCGVNIAHVPEGMPYAVTSLGPQFDVGAVLGDLASHLVQWLGVWDSGRGFATIREAWMARAAGVGGEILVDGQSGRFDGIAMDGALLMTQPGRPQQVIHAGDVQFAARGRVRSGEI